LHFTEWIAAGKTGSPTSSNFADADPLSGTVPPGHLAVRLGMRIDWDSQNLMPMGCSKADALIRYECRKGWTLLKSNSIRTNMAL